MNEYNIVSMKKIIYIISILFAFSCDNSDEKSDMNMLKANEDSSKVISISRTVLDEMMRTLPSPIEVANIITKTNKNFNKDILIPTNISENIPDKHSQALLLGGLGVDLGYLNLNDKTIYVINYLEAIRNVSKELKVDQYFDFSMLSNLAKNRNNVDSLISLSTKNFNQIDEYLRTQNRGDLSVLILIGSWVEGMYMFNDIATKNPNDDIIKRIGEQKIIIDNIFSILIKIENIEYYKSLKEKLMPLKTTYDKIKIAYVYHEPVTKEVNGELVIEDNTETVINMTKEDLAAISKEINSLRNIIFLIKK